MRRNNAEDSDQRQGRNGRETSTFRRDGHQRLAASKDGNGFHGRVGRSHYSGSLDQLIRRGCQGASGAAVRRSRRSRRRRSPAAHQLPGIICVGLNYRDHAGESGMTVPEYPVSCCPVCVKPDRSWRADRASGGIAKPRLRRRAGCGDRQGRAPYQRRECTRARRRLLDLSMTPRSAIFSCAPRNGPWARTSTPPARSAPGS